MFSAGKKRVTRAYKKRVKKDTHTKPKVGGGYGLAQGKKGTALHKNPSNRKRVLKRIEKDTIFQNKPAKTRKGRKQRTETKKFLNRRGPIVPYDTKKKTPFRGRK